MTLTTRLLLLGLFGLAALFLFWFSREGWPTLLLFAGPPLLLGALAWRGGHLAPFWAGVLALVVIFAASLPGLRARFGGRR